MTPYQIADRIMAEYGTSIEHVANDTYRTADTLSEDARRKLQKALIGVGVKARTACNRVYCELQVSQPIF